MKLSKTILIGVCIVVIVLAVLSFRSCGLSSEYKALKADYDNYKTTVESAHQEAIVQITKLTEDIAVRDAHIAALAKAVTEKDTIVTKLSTELSALQHAEPSQPELEKEPLVVNLRLQIKTLTNMFSLSQSAGKDKDAIIDNWSKKFDAMKVIADTWHKSYDNEHTLRLMGEGLVKNLESQVRAKGFWGGVKNVALGLAAGYVIYSLVK